MLLFSLRDDRVCKECSLEDDVVLCLPHDWLPWLLATCQGVVTWVVFCHKWRQHSITLWAFSWVDESHTLVAFVLECVLSWDSIHLEKAVFYVVVVWDLVGRVCAIHFNLVLPLVSLVQFSYGGVNFKVRGCVIMMWVVLWQIHKSHIVEVQEATKWKDLQRDCNC